MDSHARGRTDAWRRHLPWPLLALVLTGLGGWLAAGPPQTPNRPVPMAELATARLSDDAVGRPLFAVADFVPDVPASRCLRVAYAGTATTGVVFIDAVDVSGALAPYLQVRVAQGAGGRFGDCTGFVGVEVFRGMLPDLASSSAGPAATGWTPRPDTDRTFEITVTLRDGAPQATSASATFRWLLMDAVVPPGPQPPTAPTALPPTHSTVPPAPTTLPPTPSASTPPPSASASPSAGERAQTTTAPMPSASTSAAPVRVTHGRGGGAGGMVDNLLTRAGDVAGTLVRVTAGAGRFIAAHGRYPAIPAALLGGFLAVQNWIDRRDPKLARAPLWRDVYLYYDTPTGDRR